MGAGKMHGQELPGMWENADFTGGDPDERSYRERREMTQNQICAWCLTLIFRESTYVTGATVMRPGDDGNPKADVIYVPSDIVNDVLKGNAVMLPGYGQIGGLAVTAMNGTPFCAHHGIVWAHSTEFGDKVMRVDQE